MVEYASCLRYEQVTTGQGLAIPYITRRLFSYMRKVYHEGVYKTCRPFSYTDFVITRFIATWFAIKAHYLVHLQACPNSAITSRWPSPTVTRSEDCCMIKLLDRGSVRRESMKLLEKLRPSSISLQNKHFL